MSVLQGMAKDLGAAIGRSDEYQALKRAIAAADEDRDFVQLRNELQELEGRIEEGMRAGEQPSEEIQQEYQRIVERLQVHATYQRLVAAQTNFEKLMNRVNETIAAGMKDGGESRIVLAT